MNKRLADSWKSLLRLVRFLSWYGMAVAALFYVLPAAGLLAEEYYDELDGALKLLLVLAIIGVAGAWQVLAWRDGR